MKTSLLTSVAFFVILVTNAIADGGVLYPPRNAYLELPVLFVEVADDNGENRQETYSTEDVLLIDFSGMQELMGTEETYVLLRYLPKVQLDCTDLLDIETWEEAEKLGRRQYPHPKVRALFKEYGENILIYFLVRSRPECHHGLCGLGFSKGRVAISALGDELDPDRWTTHPLHEIGHCLGLDHVDDPSNVMTGAGTSSESTNFTYYQIETMRQNVYDMQLWGQDLDRLEREGSPRYNGIHPFYYWNGQMSTSYREIWFSNLWPGRMYALERSTDMKNWEELLQQKMNSESYEHKFVVDRRDFLPGSCFFRIRLLPR